MIGSPASRGAVSSLDGAGRDCLAVASKGSAIGAVITANVAMTASFRRHVVTFDCAIVIRFAMSGPVGCVCVSVRPSINAQCLDKVLSPVPLVGLSYSEKNQSFFKHIRR